MNFGILIPITAILATAWVLVTLLRFRHGRRDGRPDGPAGIAGAEENARLAHENQSLRLTIDKLEARMAVLERIATDPAERTAREIENLR